MSVEQIATEFVGGVVFLATFGGLKVAESDEVEALRAMNGLNAGSAVTIAYMGASRNVALSAWYPLPYSKASFSAFSEQWHREQTKFAVAKILDFTETVKAQKAAEVKAAPVTEPASP